MKTGIVQQEDPADVGIGGLMVTGLMLRSTMESDPLPSWNNTAAKKLIVYFVERVTKKGSLEFVPVTERIATFDTIGTLWAEQPMYFQLAFAIDRVKALAPQHPEWTTQQPFASLINGDIGSALEGRGLALAQIMRVAQEGLTDIGFQALVQEWVRTALHPRFNRPYTECIYQPMLELLSYLRTHGFKTYVISGGGVEFMRAWVPEVYGILAEEVIGSMARVNSAKQPSDSGPVELPIGIHRFNTRRPIAAFGNSGGDSHMLEWTNSGSGLRLALLIRNGDGEVAVQEAYARGWTVIDMKSEWKTIFPK